MQRIAMLCCYVYMFFFFINFIFVFSWVELIYSKITQGEGNDD